MTDPVNLKLTDMGTPRTAAQIPGNALVYFEDGLDRVAIVDEFATALYLRAFVATAYAAVIPLDAQRVMAQHAIDAPITFTVASSPVTGARCYLRLQADGTNIPAFTGMTEHSSSTGFVNTTGTMNYVWFWFDGTGSFYSATTAKADAPFSGGGVASKYSGLAVGDSILAIPGSNSPFMLMGYDPTIVRLNQDAPLAVAGDTLLALSQGELGTGGYGQYYDPTRVNIIFFQRCTNDLGNVGASAVSTYALLAAEIAKAKIAGFVAVAMTCLPRADPVGSTPAFPWTSGKVAERVAYNNLVRANSAAADYVFDITTNATMGPDAAATNAALYGDGLHPTSAGYTALIPSYKAAFDYAMTHAMRFPALQPLTLDRTIYPGTPASGAIVGATYGSNIISHVAGLTINNALRTFAWDGGGASATTPVGLTENLYGNARSSPITVQSGSAPNYLRLPVHLHVLAPDGHNYLDYTTGFAETGDDATGYVYTPSGTVPVFGTPTDVSQDIPLGASFSPMFGYPTKKLPANTAGWIQLTWGMRSDNDFGRTIALHDISDGSALNVTGGAQRVLGVSDHPAFGNRYEILNASGYTDPTTSVAIDTGDLVRVERTISGGVATIAAKVSKNSGSTWTVIYSLANATLAELTPVFGTNYAGALHGTLTRPLASQSVV